MSVEMVTRSNIKRVHSFKHPLHSCSRMPEEYSLLKLFLDVLWITWLNVLSFTCNKTNLILKDHSQIYLKLLVILPGQQ